MNASNKDGSNKDDAKQNDFISSVTEKLSDVLEDVTDKIGIDNPLTPIDETSKTNSTPPQQSTTPPQQSTTPPPPSNTPPAPPPAPQPSPMSILSDNINPVQPPSPPKDTPTEQNMPEQVILKGFKELEQPKKKKKKVIIKTTSKSSKKSVIPEIKETNRSIAKDNSVIDISLIPKTKINTNSLEEIYNEKQFELIETFYNLKSNYDKKKKKILKDLKKKQTIDSKINIKQSYLKKIEKIQCINCKRKVGNYFSTKNRQLILKCGLYNKNGIQDSPCELSLDITLPKTYLYKTMKQDFEIEKENISQEILKLSYDHAYKYKNDQEVIKVRDELLPKLKENEEINYYYLNKYVNLYHSKEKNDYINKLKLDIDAYLKDYNMQVNDCINDNNISLASLIETNKELSELYLKLRENTYDYYDMLSYETKDKDKKNIKHKLILIEKHLINLELVYDNEFSVNENTLKI